MNELSSYQEAVELLQKLGLKEYEAKCFVALSRLPKATAKEISETSDVPRTRVYDAIRVLETKGLAEVQHSNPQQFRAVPIAEAAKTLRSEYESRTESLVDALESMGTESLDADREMTHEVWALSGPPAIENRLLKLVDTADQEVVLILGRESAATTELFEHVRAARESGVDVLVGTATPALHDMITEALPDIEVFVSELAWLRSSPTDPTDDTTISRLLLVDRNTILVSSVQEDDLGAVEYEKAVFGRGFDNGMVVIARRLMAAGLKPGDDPKPHDG
ncbi:Sugar-specific transcriptional regulator TrmB [Halopelagius inordinatus]|uniref:Sugar-specific transcriptional regulator TrmB n=1 Tax=Halopelagius inordinatus TaxID=553467 RepID=A0A1I2WHR5_9EURY|nr:helix-turn-helix domain-containing protein [Halopelagius inordinatus]SFH00824.1 Sugar-specific transcriptional regulator TrmB [Halopelagius inordinatus]